MKAICDIEDTYMLKPLGRSCPSHSLPYYVGTMSGKSCHELDQEDLDKFSVLLKQCSVHYFNNDLKPSLCSSDSSTCPSNGSNIPAECSLHNAVYNTLHFLSDTDFIKEGVSPSTGDSLFLSLTQLIFRRSWNIDRDEMFDYYLETLDGKSLENDLVEVKAMDVNYIAEKVANYYVFQDLPLYGVAMALVIIVLFLYLRSFALMFVVVLNVGLSLFVSYFIYHVVCRFVFFGFTNLLAGLLLIAIGADDVFIFFDIWHKVKADMPETERDNIEKIASKTLHHGILSILVTSLTTAAALFANGISAVIALRCFGIFGGICIAVNLFFMVTLVPAILVMMEKAGRKYPKVCNCSWADKCTKVFAKMSHFIWFKIVPNVVIKIWPIWLFIFLGFGIYGFVVVFYKPKLELPKTEIFQQYYSEHPFEVYVFQMRDRFRFEIENRELSRVTVSLNFVFGIEGEDNGNVFNPDDPGTLIFDSEFEIGSLGSQMWMLRFCQNLLEDSLINSPENYICFFDLVQMVTSSQCMYHHLNISLNPLCCSTGFPLPQKHADICFKDLTFIRLIHMLSHNQTLIGAPVYDVDHNIKATVYTVETKQKWNALYSVMDQFYNHFYDFMTKELEDATDGVKGGWFTGSQGQELYFYDLMGSMVQGVISGIGLAMAIAFLVMLLTSMNFFITVYAIFTIVFVITVTIGILVHLGWGLNLNEAVVITLTIGLSIDFTIHFGVAYKLSPHQDRKSRVKDAITVVGFAVTMAALTTFLAGAALIGGKLLSYYRFGLFLMLDMTVSWVYALFFFLPMCLFIGPVGTFGELGHLSCCRKKLKKQEKDVILSNGNIISAFDIHNLSKDGPQCQGDTCDSYEVSVNSAEKVTSEKPEEQCTDVQQ